MAWAFNPFTGKFDYYVAASVFIDNEIPSGTVNGANDTFNLAHIPNPATSLQFFINGMLMSAGGEDYTLVGLTITTVTAPPTGSILKVWYRY